MAMMQDSGSDDFSDNDYEEVDFENSGSGFIFKKRFQRNISYEERVDEALKWLDLPPSKRPSIITLYFNEPDHTGHKNRPSSKEVNKALEKVDRTIRRLFSGLQKRGLIDCINVIIVSDHGMTDFECTPSIHLGDYVNVSSTQIFFGTSGRIQIVKGANTSLEAVEEAFRCRNPHMKVYRKELLPVRMHYSHHPRIEPIFVYMDKGWRLTKEPDYGGDHKGHHGYDTIFPEMRAFFMAIGPSMKKNATVEPFINTELYELMCELIEITPNPNNGTRGSLHHLLQDPRHPLMNQTEIQPPTTITENIRTKNDKENAGCSCHRAFHSNVSVTASEALHLPFGTPHSTAGNDHLILLHNTDYVLAYCSEEKMAAWVAFTLPRKAAFLSQENNCWTADPRVSENTTAKCTYYDSKFFKMNYISQRPLYPPVFSKPSENKAAMFVTNSIPKSGNHTILEERMTRFLREWATKKGPLNVLTGPAFDFQATGIKPESNIFKEMKKGPLLIPTHIFLVITWCSKHVQDLKLCKPTCLVSRSFLLPNWPYPKNCEATDTTIQLNMARVVDVEKLTGLSLYRDLPIYEAVRLRTSLSHE